MRGREYKTTNTMYRVQLGLNAQIIKGLNYDMRVQYESTSSEYKNYDSEDTFYARNLVNSYTEYNNETQEVGFLVFLKVGSCDQVRRNIQIMYLETN